MTPLSQKIYQGYGAMQKEKKKMHTQRRYATYFGMSKIKEIKDAYPKKLCDILRHVKKKKKKKR